MSTTADDYEDEHAQKVMQDMIDTVIADQTGVHIKPDQGRTTAVVAEFMDPAAGYSAQDATRYINTALINQAWSLREDHQRFELVDKVRTGQEGYREGWDYSGAEELSAMYQEERQRAQSLYDEGRSDLAQALTDVRVTGKHLLATDTAAMVVELDHDGYMSEAMGVDVTEVYGTNPAYQRPDLVAEIVEERRRTNEAFNADLQSGVISGSAPISEPQRTTAQRAGLLKPVLEVHETEDSEDGLEQAGDDGPDF